MQDRAEAGSPGSPSAPGSPLHWTARGWAAALAAVLAAGSAPAGLVAQTPPAREAEAQRLAEQYLGRPVSHDEIIERLRQSGLTREQLRARLSQMGYDPGLVDQYYAVIERGSAAPTGGVSTDVVQALNQVGLTLRSTVPADTIPGLPVDTLPADTLVVDSLAPGELPIFGRDVFHRATSQFQPVVNGPVDPDYRLGPGDQLVLVLTGDVEAAYTLDVTRDGYIVIPDVGQIFVNGVTLRDLEDRLYSRLGGVYSGIGRSANATAHFQVSLGQLRTNQVFLIGEVERPGAYQISSVATVFNALYQARGPSENGSFRRIQVRRGGEVIRVVDVYDYLLQGDSRNDIRLEQGDVIFVPVVGRQVTLKGAVRRPAIYELDDDDGLRDLLAYAGGTDATALVRRVQIDRIVPPDARRPGIDRVLVDVDVLRLASRDGEFVPLQDGDIVQVFSVSEERRRRLTLTGEVRRPGMYEWSPGTTLWSVIDRADGLEEEAYTPRAHIYRLNEEDGTRRLIRTPLLADSDGQPIQDVELADRDSVVILSRSELRTQVEIAIAGAVKNPGTYTLAEGMTVHDLILAAGGFQYGANTWEADVARRPDVTVRTDTTALVYRVTLDPGRADGSPGYLAERATADRAENGVPVWVPSADEFELRADDRVFVRRAPGYESLHSVVVAGEVTTPGGYILRSRRERLLDVLERAGGMTPDGNAEGLRLMRGGSLVATDLPRALRDPASRYNLVLEPGDSIVVPRFDPTVLVTGAVGFESRVLFEPGKNLDYYINRAGGYRDDADPDRVSVAYQDGERATMNTRFLLPDSRPQVSPGSTVIVPRRPETQVGFDWDRFLSRTLSIVSTTVTLIIAADRLNN